MDNGKTRKRKRERKSKAKGETVDKDEPSQSKSNGSLSSFFIAKAKEVDHALSNFFTNSAGPVLTPKSVERKGLINDNEDTDEVDPARKGKKRLRPVSDDNERGHALAPSELLRPKIKGKKSELAKKKKKKIDKESSESDNDDEDGDDLETMYERKRIPQENNQPNEDETEDNEEDDDDEGDEDDEEGDDDGEDEEDEEVEDDNVGYQNNKANSEHNAARTHKDHKIDNSEKLLISDDKDLESSESDSDDDENEVLVHESLLFKEDEKKNLSLLTPEERKERNSRTIFVGNVPVSCASKKSHSRKLKMHFATYGPVESIRFRSIAFETTSLPRKAAFLKKKFHPERETVNAYIVYTKEAGKQAAITAAKALNATTFLDHSIRVDALCESQKVVSDKGTTRRTIFIGNLPFEVQDQIIWDFFSAKVGDVESVRVIRDRKTNLGKGFAYVMFKDRTSVDLAIAVCETEKLAKRKVRVERCKSQSVVEKKENKFISSSNPLASKKPYLGNKPVNTKPASSVIEGIRASKGSNPAKVVKGRTRKPRIQTRSQAYKNRTRK